MSSRNLVIGLDGADLTLIQTLGRQKLPFIHGLMDRGVFAASRSLVPPSTLPNWTSFLTGVNPGQHGVFDFTTRNGYRVRFTGGTVRATPTWITHLDQSGLKCACIGFPATWPPEKLQHGVFISGWDSPVAFEADSSFVWPPQMFDDLRRRFGSLHFDDADEFGARAPGWHDSLGKRLCARIEKKTEWLKWLLDSKKWDLFAVYFGESDTASHHLWSLHDEHSPRRPASLTQCERNGLTKVYESLDAAVGQLVSFAGGESVEVTLISDHGSGGSSDKVLYLNRALEQSGLLAFRKRSSWAREASALKDIALTKMPPSLRERIYAFQGRALPGWLESQARYGAIDFHHTQAFSDELNYFPSIHFNVHGREPQGIVQEKDLSRLRNKVEDALRALIDPWSKKPVIQAVHRREQLFSGPHIYRAPDLLLDICLDGGYSYNLMPSSSAPVGTGAWRKLDTREYLDRKGRSLSGSHRPYGLFVAAGPRVPALGEIKASILDASAITIARTGEKLPAHLEGQLQSFVTTTSSSYKKAQPPQNTSSHTKHDEARVENRLRALGYID